MMNFLIISGILAYYLLGGSSILTVFEILNTFPLQYQILRTILIIETIVNIIASIAYNFLQNEFILPVINYKKITKIRYIDWLLTTPLLLLSFILYLQYKNTNEQKTIENTPKIDSNHLGIIICLNFLMLLCGILGELGIINYIIACILGFIPFIIMFYLIWKWYGNYETNKNIYIIFVIVWSLYGLVYFLPNYNKNICYNILDIIAKVGFGLFIWFEVVNLRINNFTMDRNITTDITGDTGDTNR
jgi:sensory rhodopsin